MDLILIQSYFVEMYTDEVNYDDYINLIKKLTNIVQEAISSEELTDIELTIDTLKKLDTRLANLQL